MYSYDQIMENEMGGGWNVALTGRAEMHTEIG